MVSNRKARMLLNLTGLDCAGHGWTRVSNRRYSQFNRFGVTVAGFQDKPSARQNRQLKRPIFQYIGSNTHQPC